VAEARAHDYRWGSTPLKVVDQVTYLSVHLNCAWTWDMHIAAAYHKGLGAFRTWRPVLTSPRIKVAVKLRIIDSVIHPVLEYAMEVWGPRAQLAAGTRMRGGPSRIPPLLHLDKLLLSWPWDGLKLSHLRYAPGFKSRSAQSHLSSFRTSSWAGCVLGFWGFPLYELHVYSFMWSEAEALSEYA
jgi:hypothetical protein